MQDWIASASPRSFLAEDHTKWHLVVSDFDKSFENQSAIDLRKIGGQLTMARSCKFLRINYIKPKNVCMHAL